MTLIAYLFPSDSKSQIANYISNGGFEVCSNCATVLPSYKAKDWEALDTISSFGYFFCSKNPPASNLPYMSTGFQYPRTGDNIALCQFYCTGILCGTYSSRGYPRNRLKALLKPNKVYCAKYYVVNTNHNRIAIENYGLYAGDSSLDTIKYCNIALSYLIPQVEYSGGIITDTLNWTAVSGTFIATGTEKYVLLGNFRSNAATDTMQINPTMPTMSNDNYIDDVSLIEMDLPAYAGPDRSLIPGDSVFIGREPDVEIDESCIWYKMTSPTTTVTLDTIAGMWVKPAVTTTYVVRQQLWCSGVKWDTVVIFQDAVGFDKLEVISKKLKVIPVPAHDYFELQIDNDDLLADFKTLSIFNTLGELLREEEIEFKESPKINASDLPNGAYFLSISDRKNGIIKKLIVAR